MRVVRAAAAQAAMLFADAGRVPVRALMKSSAAARLGDDIATSTRAVITSSVFIVLLVTALLVGGHAAIDPFLHRSPDIDARGSGDVVVAMPDGKFCRHMSFDNTTASMIEGTIEPCRVDITRDKGPAMSTEPRGFAWGVH
jgi:hypothetical protein